MQTRCVGVHATTRTALLVSANASFRHRLAETLTGMRWKVREASGGAEALGYLEEMPSEALLLDSWLPDLEANDFAEQLRLQYPALDLICVNETESMVGKTRSVRRPELLYALRRVQEGADAAEHREGPGDPLRPMSPGGLRSPEAHGINPAGSFVRGSEAARTKADAGVEEADKPQKIAAKKTAGLPEEAAGSNSCSTGLLGLIGSSAQMQQLAHSIRLVATRKTTVLIEGPTGSGKELVAHALHRLSARANRPFAVLNCAAIPEALLEAELFGHTRGAFTGAAQARTGRIEAAHGGTLFLDEIGEMPLALQAKVLRFLEAGELQRIGENEPIRVDVRVIAATHQPLMRCVEEGKFREDLYFRLAVFPIQTPSLAERPGDIPELAMHFLRRLGEAGPAKTLAPDAIDRLCAHSWPGNVRELAHVVERAYILAEDRPQITAEEIRVRSRERLPGEPRPLRIL